MTTHQQVSDSLSEFVRTEILGSESAVAMSDDLLGEGIIDSLGIMRLVAHIESVYHIGVPPEDVTIDNFSTLEVMGHYVAAKTCETQNK